VCLLQVLAGSMTPWELAWQPNQEHVEERGQTVRHSDKRLCDAVAVEKPQLKIANTTALRIGVKASVAKVPHATLTQACLLDHVEKQCQNCLAEQQAIVPCNCSGLALMHTHVS
jgi:hypothetical protein